MLSGHTCREDIDECVSQPCFPGVGCNNTLGSFICGVCPQGYSGDGKNCTRKTPLSNCILKIEFHLFNNFHLLLIQLHRQRVHLKDMFVSSLLKSYIYPALSLGFMRSYIFKDICIVQFNVILIILFPR